MNNSSDFPVLDGAWPVLGHMGEMYRSFPSLCDRGTKAHGPLFWILGGPGARQLMYTAPQAINLLKHPAVSNAFYTEGFSALLGNTLFALDGDEHRRVRQAMTPPFTPQRVRASDIVDIVVDAVERRVDSWTTGAAFDVVNEIREMGLEVIFRIVGVPITDLAEWRKHYGRFLLAAIPSQSRSRGPITWYAGRARSWLDARLGGIVDSLRKSGETSTLVGAVANGRGEDGQLLDRQLVIDNIRILIFAGHETSASTMTWATLHLAASPRFQRRAIAEAEEISDVPAAAMDASRFTFGEKMFREALRRYPVVHSVIRRVKAPIEVDGKVIPAGALLNIPFVHMLRDPERFPSPDTFDPDRWKERPRPGTVETCMFGGGPHFCLGYHVAIAEGTLFALLLARALGRKRLQLERCDGAPVPPPVYLPLTHPPSRIKLRLIPTQRTGEAHAHQ
jgi:cytochrome P450